MCEVSALSHRIRNPCMCRLNDLNEKRRVKPINYSKCGYFPAGRWLGPIDLLVRDNYVTNVLLKKPLGTGAGGGNIASRI
jgi:hypothetical protein